MKVITNRYEIAQALNFGRYPVIKVNCTPKASDPEVIEGGAVKVLTDERRNLVERCTVNLYANEYANDGHRNMSIGSAGVMLSASFSRKDVEEMATYANAPLIKKGDTVVFVLLGKRAAAVVLAEVKEVRSFCQKSAWLEDDAEDTIAYLAWNLAMM